MHVAAWFDYIRIIMKPKTNDSECFKGTHSWYTILKNEYFSIIKNSEVYKKWVISMKVKSTLQTNI